MLCASNEGMRIMLKEDYKTQRVTSLTPSTHIYIFKVLR